MEAHLLAWFGLLLRWFHLIAGVAWIGASFYFNWLENRLQRRNAPDAIAGDLWAVHGGGFYYLQKFAVAPDQLPPVLHWFKWEAYATWFSGLLLLVVVFYWNAPVYLLGPEATGTPVALAVAAGLATLAASWLVYDLLCRSRLGSAEAWIAALVLAWFAALTWLLSGPFTGRAAFIHVGAAIGTVMVANVFRVIIPAQQDLVSAVAEQREPDGARAASALQRSRHNNYLTLPVLFIMISGHFPAVFEHAQNWLVLLSLSLAGVSIRHYFNIRHLHGARLWPLFVAGALLAGVVWFTAPGRAPAGGPGVAKRVATTEVLAIAQRRCVGCHASEPAIDGFSAAPLGIELDSAAKLVQHAERVYQTAVVSRTMPLANLTRITEAERRVIAYWFGSLNDISGNH